MRHKQAYLDGCQYDDWGPKPTAESDVRKQGAWMQRPFCDMCGPFRGRYLRPLRNYEPELPTEYRCHGCDVE